MMKYPDSAMFLFGLVKRCRKYSLVINGEVSEQHSITESVSAHLDRLDEMNMDYYIFEARAINFLLEQAAK